MKIVLFFELVWNVLAILNKTKQNWQSWLYMDCRLTKTIPISLVNNCSSLCKRLILLKHNMMSQKHHSTRSYQPSFVWMILRLANYTTSPLNPPLPVHHLMHVSAKFINTLLQIRKLIPSKMWGKTTLEHHGTSRAYWKLNWKLFVSLAI